MSKPQYVLPDSVQSLFQEKEASYKIVDYTIRDMDNIESMQLFIECVGLENHIALNDGTQVTFYHPDFNYHIVIDSGGLGDFYSHGFEASIVTVDEYRTQLENKLQKMPSSEMQILLNKEKTELTAMDLNKILDFLVQK